jgi:choline kinase
MNVVILGDKFQKGKKTKGCSGLFKVKNTYLILKQYRAIRAAFPKSNIVYVCGFEYKKLLSTIDDYDEIVKNINFIINENYNKYNYGYSLQLLKEYITQKTLILFGDSIIDYKILNTFDCQNNVSQIVLNKKSTSSLGCVINNKKIHNIFYDLDNKIEEMYFIANKDIGKLKDILDQPIKNMFIFEIINKMIDNNVSFQPLKIEKVNYVA